MKCGVVKKYIRDILPKRRETDKKQQSFSIRYPSFFFFKNPFLCSIAKIFIKTVHLAILVLWYFYYVPNLK